MLASLDNDEILVESLRFKQGGMLTPDTFDCKVMLLNNVSAKC